MGRGREKLCPMCGEDITDSYEGYDPDVGIMSGGWYCTECEHPVPEEDDQSDYESERAT